MAIDKTIYRMMRSQHVLTLSVWKQYWVQIFDHFVQKLVLFVNLCSSGRNAWLRSEQQQHHHNISHLEDHVCIRKKLTNDFVKVVKKHLVAPLENDKP